MKNAKTASYAYEFVDGKSYEINGTEYWVRVLQDEDRRGYVNNHHQYRGAGRCRTELGEIEKKLLLPGVERDLCNFTAISAQCVFSASTLY